MSDLRTKYYVLMYKIEEIYKEIRANNNNDNVIHASLMYEHI